MDWLSDNWDRIENEYPGKDRDSVINRVTHRTFITLGESFKLLANKEGNRDIALPTYYFNAKDDKQAIFSRHLYQGTWFENETEFEKLVRERLMKITKKTNKILLFFGVFSLLNIVGFTLVFMKYRKKSPRRVIHDDALLEYFHRGLIPGPDESEEAFLFRVEQAKPLAHPEWSDLALPFKIDWVPITYSNHKIAWWEGAATWISGEDLPAVQLRKSFERGFFLGYKRSEVLSHEAVHAARMRFEEPLFEEVLAYSTASQAWKRFLGPLFSRTWDLLY